MIPELKTLFIAMSPIVELRGAIPIALEVYKLPVWSAFLFSILGDLLPTVFLLLLLEPAYKYLSRRFLFFERFFRWLFERTRRKYQGRFSRWEKFALTILVAIPLPFTGAWTAALCSFVFGISMKEAIPLIALGIIMAGVIVTLASLGIFGFLDFIV